MATYEKNANYNYDLVFFAQYLQYGPIPNPYIMIHMQTDLPPQWMACFLYHQD